MTCFLIMKISPLTLYHAFLQGEGPFGWNFLKKRVCIRLSVPFRGRGFPHAPLDNSVYSESPLILERCLSIESIRDSPELFSRHDAGQGTVFDQRDVPPASKSSLKIVGAL